ncbi:zinc-ribbon domain-containing protein [Arthrobacter sp. Soc17.1.1.1]|uniref:zinc-ribbon domain-containing protein n=1 Tax=Arthrobacter sp. Soc17.1.1.1 TaxID=3121277 RepID=UPI003FA5B667
MCPSGHIVDLSRNAAQRADGKAFACPLCSGQRIVFGYNSLADVLPYLAREWDEGGPSDHGPWEVGPGSNFMGHWICPKGHHYPATFANRALRGSGCPACSGKGVIAGANDLCTTHPELAALWDPNSTNTWATNQVSAGNSKHKLNWRCPFGHPFVRTTAKLVETNGRCQTCTGRVLIPGENDLGTARPDVAAQWHPHLNGKMTPADVKPGSEVVVWWLCPAGHEFPMQVDHRCRGAELTCPKESGRMLEKGVSDLEFREPELCEDWDSTLNGKAPDEVVPGSGRWWWTCRAGHPQYRSVVNRRRAGGCTECPPEERVAAGSRKNTRGRQGWDKRIVALEPENLPSTNPPGQGTADD